MRPNYHPEGLYDDNKVNTESKVKENTIKQLWHVNGMCDEGTIPIRRTKEDDVLRASSVKRYGKKKHTSMAMPNNIPKSADPDLVNQSGHQVNSQQNYFTLIVNVYGFIELDRAKRVG